MIKPEKIILVSIDTLRSDHLGCYGYGRNTSPNIDELANESILFRNAFSPSSHTIPSHGSILTGKYPSNHSIGFNQNVLVETGKLNTDIEITLAEILNSNGYKTAAFVSGIVLRTGTNFNAGFEEYHDDIGSDKYGRKDCARTNQEVFSWLDDNYPSDFFLFIHYFDVHGPYLNCGHYSDIFIGDDFYGQPEYLEDVFDAEPKLNSIPYYQILNPIIDENGNIVDYEKDIRFYKAQYDSCIRYLDDNIGELFRKLKELGIYDNTLVIITSDHGEAFGENNIYLYHGLSVTLDQIAVPLLFKPHKGLDVKGKIIDTHVGTIDIMPTILSMCGCSNAEMELEGDSLEKIIVSREDSLLDKRTLISENERQYALIKPNRLIELKKKDVATSTYYPYIPSLIDSLDGKKYCWNTGKEYALALVFDEYQRYKIISEIVNKYRKNDEKFRILEVGAGYGEVLSKFLPNDEIYFLDIVYTPEYKKRSNYIVGDITTLNLSETYDFVVSSDVYEHIPHVSRTKFIKNIIFHSDIATIIAAPFDTQGVREFEILANEVYKFTHGIEHKWLHEHIQNGLPSLPYTLELINNLGFTHSVIPNGYLPRWFEMISAYLLTEGVQEFSTCMGELYEFYNKNFYDYDIIDPAYRHVVVIFKDEKNPEFSDIYSKTFDLPEDLRLKSHMLQSYLIKIREFYNDYKYRDMKEKEKQIIELVDDLEEKDEQVIKLAKSLDDKDGQITELYHTITKLNSTLEQKSAYVRSMQQSIVWRFVMKYHNIIERLFPNGTKRRRYYNMGFIATRTLVNEGWKSLWQKYRDYRFSNKILYKKITVPKLDLQPIDSTKDLKKIEKKVSIIIPTKNASPDFEYTLEKIRRSKGIQDVELIIVDSGSTDETIKLAERYDSKIYNIKPEEFNHGDTRNYGAEKASGDYIVFMVQDAIPIGNYWLYNMVKVLESDNQIAAATARQIPRSDADLFACSSLWNHYRVLGSHEDKIYSGIQKFDDLSPIDKRRVAGLENVCTLIRKSIFDDFKFKNYSYAEDLDFGLRLARSGHGIAFLHTVGVIHSHNRNAGYFIKRGYLDNKLLPEILEYDPAYYINTIAGIKELFGNACFLYSALNASIDYLNSFAFNQEPSIVIAEFKNIIQNNSKKHSTELDKFRLGDSSLDYLFDEMQKIVGSTNIKSNEILLQHFFYLVDDLGVYLKNNQTLAYEKHAFIDALYKYFAITIGAAFSNYYVFKHKNEEIDNELLAIDNILSEGV